MEVQQELWESNIGIFQGPTSYMKPSKLQQLKQVQPDK